MREHTFAIGGQPYFAMSAGDPTKPLILCLHGFPEYSGAYHDLLPLLARDHFVVAPDQRGYGQSWRPDEVAAYAMPNLVADACAMIDHFSPKGRAAAVIGHDWGASVAYMAAIRQPAKIDQLVIANGVHPIPFQTALAAGGAQSAASQYINWLRRDGSQTALAADNYARLLRLLNEGMDLAWLTPTRRAKYEAAWGGEQGLKTMIHWYRASPLHVAAPDTPLPPDALPTLDPVRFQVPMPHLLLWGDADTALLPESRAGLEDFCPDLTIRTHPTADHWLLHTHPDWAAQEILTFLAGPHD